MKNATVAATFVTFTFSDFWPKKIGEKLTIKQNPSYEELNMICYYALRHSWNCTENTIKGNTPSIGL